jgi:ADP-dependent phosphofructokinase/glucokinase
MAVCGVDPVYVHCASLPKVQSELFLNVDNLLSVNSEKELEKTFNIEREKDIPLIHYIIEFDKGDTISVDGKSYTCPKSNRFIATYDPLNFILHIDDAFVERLSASDINLDFIILSGYQMLQETVSEGIKGIDRIQASMHALEKLRANKSCITHFEIASTQDKTIRKYLTDHIADKVDSLGFNERELIDILEVIEEDELCKTCNKEPNSVNLFKAMLKVFKYTNCPRLQLHMFGLYLTVQAKGHYISPLQNRKGMQLAANIAAAKAATGSVDRYENLSVTFGKEVSDHGLKELEILAEFCRTEYGVNQLTETGIVFGEEFDIIAVPTIIVDNPVTLVGMGDTISSVSLVASV